MQLHTPMQLFDLFLYNLTATWLNHNLQLPSTSRHMPAFLGQNTNYSWFSEIGRSTLSQFLVKLN